MQHFLVKDKKLTLLFWCFLPKFACASLRHTRVRLIRRHSLWQKSLKNARKFIFYKIIIEFIKPLAFNFNKLALLIKKLQFIILEFL